MRAVGGGGGLRASRGILQHPRRWLVFREPSVDQEDKKTKKSLQSLGAAQQVSKPRRSLSHANPHTPIQRSRLLSLTLFFLFLHLKKAANLDAFLPSCLPAWLFFSLCALQAGRYAQVGEA